MKINKGYKTEMAPKKAQRVLLAKSVGTARFAYNWGLARRIEEYKYLGKSANAIQQHKQLNSMKEDFFPWMYEVSKCAPQEALRDLDKAYDNFYNGGGFPKFKSKHDKQSCRFSMGIQVKNKSIRLPNIGWVKLKEKGYIPTEGHILSATISKKAGKWFVSVAFEEEIEVQSNSEGVSLGLDAGIKSLGVVSNNVTFKNPKALKNNIDKLARLQRKQARQEKGSKNRDKTKLKIQKLHYKISCVRNDAIHKMTTAVAKTKPQRVVIEDLAIKNMMKNHKLARSIADAAFGEIRRQLEYKGKWYGFDVVVADRWFPSSKMCSRCGHIKVGLKLSDRIYICSECGLVIDRDLNAAINLSRYTTESSSGSNACGDEGSKPRRKTRERKKQEHMEYEKICCK